MFMEGGLLIYLYRACCSIAQLITETGCWQALIDTVTHWFHNLFPQTDPPPSPEERVVYKNTPVGKQLDLILTRCPAPSLIYPQSIFVDTNDWITTSLIQPRLQRRLLFFVRPVFFIPRVDPNRPLLSHPYYLRHIKPSRLGRVTESMILTACGYIQQTHHAQKKNPMRWMHCFYNGWRSEAKEHWIILLCHRITAQLFLSADHQVAGYNALFEFIQQIKQSKPLFPSSKRQQGRCSFLFTLELLQEDIETCLFLCKNSVQCYSMNELNPSLESQLYQVKNHCESLLEHVIICFAHDFNHEKINGVFNQRRYKDSDPLLASFHNTVPGQLIQQLLCHELFRYEKKRDLRLYTDNNTPLDQTIEFSITKQFFCKFKKIQNLQQSLVDLAQQIFAMQKHCRYLSLLIQITQGCGNLILALLPFFETIIKETIRRANTYIKQLNQQQQFMNVELKETYLNYFSTGNEWVDNYLQVEYYKKESIPKIIHSLRDLEEKTIIQIDHISSADYQKSFCEAFLLFQHITTDYYPSLCLDKLQAPCLLSLMDNNAPVEKTSICGRAGFFYPIKKLSKKEIIPLNGIISETKKTNDQKNLKLKKLKMGLIKIY